MEKIVRKSVSLEKDVVKLVNNSRGQEAFSTYINKILFDVLSKKQKTKK